MIMGESGTGKELVARALHDYGKRRYGTFVAVNMAAIPKELVESELFGHERGAFTGATNRGVGRFEQAEGAARSSWTKSVTCRWRLKHDYCEFCSRASILPSVEGPRSKPMFASLPPRLATCAELIQQGLFREDLYYLLNVVPLRLPPLRERGEDVPVWF